MAIRQTEGGSVFIPDNIAGKGVMGAAEGANKVGNAYKNHKKGFWAFVLGGALVAGTLVPFIKNTTESAKDTTGAMVDGMGGLSEVFPEVCVGDACAGGGDSATNTTVESTVDGGQATGTPSVGGGSGEAPVVVAESVQMPSGSGGLAAARLCLGFSVDAPLTPTINSQWQHMQEINGPAIADGLSAGEQLAC